MPVTVCACRTSSYLALRTLPTHQPRAASCGLHLLSYTNSRQQDVATQRSTANNVVAARTATGSCRWYRVIYSTPAQVPVSIVAVAEGTTRIPGARAQGKRTISLGTACCEVIPGGTFSTGTLLLLLTCYNTAVQQAVPVDVVPW